MKRFLSVIGVCVLIVWGVFFFYESPSSEDSPFIVTVTTTEDFEGVCLENSDCSLRAALNTVRAGGRVYVPSNGTYSLSKGPIMVQEPVTIIGINDEFELPFIMSDRVSEYPSFIVNVLEGEQVVVQNMSFQTVEDSNSSVDYSAIKVKSGLLRCDNCHFMSSNVPEEYVWDRNDAAQ